MKIAIFTDTFLPNTDGVVTATISLAKGLADRGHKIFIIAPEHDNIEEFVYPNIKVIRIFAIPAFFYKGYKFCSLFNKPLLDFLKKQKIDIIHFQTPLSLGFQAILISKILKVPLVGTFHTLFTDPQYIQHIKLNNRFIQNLSWQYAKAYYNRCDIITCPSRETRKELKNHKFIDPIRVISNGVDFSKFSNTNWKKIKKLHNPNGKLLLFIGRIAYEKNIFFMLDCFKKVLKKVPGTKLMVVGDGPQMNEFKLKIRKMGLSNNVLVMGKIDHEELVSSSIFKACDLFITASTTETQGISTLEAQVNGLVCVGIDAGGIKDLITNGYNGYLTKRGSKKDFVSKIVFLLKNDSLRNKMRKNTLQEVKKHDISNIVNEWEELYLNMIKNNSAIIAPRPGESINEYRLCL